MPLLFSEGDFIITTPSSVVGIIEVKTNSKNAGMKEVIKTSNSIGNFIIRNRSHIKQIFNGIFAYEGFENDDCMSLKENLKSICEELTDRDIDNYVVNHICLNKDLFIKYWDGNDRRYVLYKIKNLAFSFFISNLAYHLVQSKSVMTNEKSIWFPAEKWHNELWTIPVKIKHK